MSARQRVRPCDGSFTRAPELQTNGASSPSDSATGRARRYRRPVQSTGRIPAFAARATAAVVEGSKEPSRFSKVPSTSSARILKRRLAVAGIEVAAKDRLPGVASPTANACDRRGTVWPGSENAHAMIVAGHSSRKARRIQNGTGTNLEGRLVPVAHLPSWTAFSYWASRSITSSSASSPASLRALR